MIIGHILQRFGEQVAKTVISQINLTLYTLQFTLYINRLKFSTQLYTALHLFSQINPKLYNKMTQPNFSILTDLMSTSLQHSNLSISFNSILNI